MSKHAGTIIGAILLVFVVLVVIATQSGHDGHRDMVLTIAASSPAPPTPTVVATPKPSPEAWDVATGVAAHGALIAWIIALGILPFAIYIGSLVVHHHRSKLPTEDWRVPFRDPAFPHVLDAHVRTSHPPVPQTYSPSLHIRNDQVPEVETPVPALPLSGSIDDLLSHGRGLAYGWRVDNGEMLVDRQVRSLLVGGVQGSGKTSFVALLVAQLVRMDARVMLADPDALNPQGLAYRLTGLGIQPEVTAREPAEVVRLVVEAQHELLTRKGQGAGADTRPYVVVVDELPECLRVLNRHDSGQLASALELIGGLSGRKHFVSVVMLGQSWAKAVVGSTAMRNLITSSAVFRIRSDEANAMTNLRAEYWRAAGPDPLDLEPGMFYAVGIDSGAVLARVPKLPDATRAPAREPLRPNRSDHFAATSPPTSPKALPKWDRSGPEVESEAAPEAAPALPVELSETEVVRLLLKGYSPSRVVRELTGQNGGERYQRFTQALSQWLVRRALGSGGGQ